jgi:uracil-DNA glycosylase
MNWTSFFEQEKQKPYFNKLQQEIEKEYNTQTVFPQKENIYKAFDLTPLDNVKVVIIGQDPYHGKGQAEGLSFSVQKGIKHPPSLKNIFKELKADTGNEIPENGSLQKWAEQGVFLLNTTLTVREKSPASHAKIGWQMFTDHVIQYINEQTEHVVFILWGAHAQKKETLINKQKHCVIKSAHPSPFSAHKGFFGSKPFSNANHYLEKHHKKPITWKL